MSTRPLHWSDGYRGRRDAQRNPEVPCVRCGYHYRARTGRMVATATGWTCADTQRCNLNIATRAHYRGDAA